MSSIQTTCICCLPWIGMRRFPWWRHQMETFFALLAICAGNSLVPAERPVTRSFDGFFGLPVNKRLSKRSWGWWFETQLRPLWRHWNVMLISSIAIASYERHTPSEEFCETYNVNPWSSVWKQNKNGGWKSIVYTVHKRFRFRGRSSCQLPNHVKRTNDCFNNLVHTIIIIIKYGGVSWIEATERKNSKKPASPCQWPEMGSFRVRPRAISCPKWR